MLPDWRPERVPGREGEPELAIWRTAPLGTASEPLVALHGITAQHRAFNAVAAQLGSERGLVGVDLRGRGDSEKPEEGYGLAAHAADVVRVLDHLRGLEDAVLLGHSMGAFVALRAALSYPERVRALVLLDGGWPREPGETGAPEEEVSEERQKEAEAVREGLARAFSRLEMTFENPDAYLEFWFPGQNLTLEDLPPELADYYLYDLEETEGGYRPKCSPVAARADAPEVSSTAPTAEEMRRVSCPVALLCASEGFFPGTSPLISEETRDLMADALGIRPEHHGRLDGANHYTMLFGDHARQVAGAIQGFLRDLDS